MAAGLQQFPALRRRAVRGAVCAALCATLCVAAQAQGVAAARAQGVALAGRMGERALLVIDGQPHTLSVGQTAAGVRLLRWADDSAEVEQAGVRTLLRVGGTPAQLGKSAPRPSAREVVLTAGPGGHFTAAGAINGRAAQFMVDTGATLVALSRDDAQRMGIDLSGARDAVTHTANGTVPVKLVTLASVRVGDLELSQVGAAILPMPMPVILLGNSFLSRLQMRRENDVMRLELR
ncbi:MAG: retropepsin-like aspartic protease [Rubrivivax sp.]|nr:retropepsin-like aspartic protease [Rubrivivax sp.]